MELQNKILSNSLTKLSIICLNNYIENFIYIYLFYWYLPIAALATLLTFFLAQVILNTIFIKNEIEYNKYLLDCGS